MHNIANVMYLFNKLVNEKYSDYKMSDLSPRDHEIADQLVLALNLLIDSSDIIEGDVILEIDDYDDENSSYSNDSDDDEQHYTITNHSYSYKIMCDIVQYANNHRFSSVKNRYRLIKQKSQLKRIRKYVRCQGTQRQKLEELDKFVFQEFNQARNKYLPIHDRGLRRIAIKKAREMKLQNFVASSFWLLSFKRRHHITSRKVTKLVTKRYVED